jgi:ABC-type oligopeptide transport system ATPase subunit
MAEPILKVENLKKYFHLKNFYIQDKLFQIEEVGFILNMM